MDKALQIKVSTTMMDLYCLYRKYWTQVNGGSVFRVPTPYDAYNIMKHLDGEYSVCVYAGENATKFLSVDVDLDDPGVVRKVIDTMVDLGIPKELIYVSFSGKKGYHVDLFFQDYVYNTYAEKFYWAMIERSGLNPRKVEYRPTHGQAIKLPLGVHQTTGKRCWFVDRDTLEPIESFEYVFGIEKIQGAAFDSIVKGIVNEHMREISNEIAREREKAKEDAKAKAIAVLTAKINASVNDANRNYDCDDLKVYNVGTRHNLQAKVAARARMDGQDYDGIVLAQMDWYDQQDKSKIRTDEDGVRKDAQELAGWAMKNVWIRNTDDNDGVVEHEVEPIRITKQMLPYILRAQTRTARLVLFLLTVFCAKYGEAKISVATIAEFLGVSDKAVQGVINAASEEGLLWRKQTFEKKSKIVTMRGANLYMLPGKKKLYAPERKYLYAEYYDIREPVTKERLRGIYYETLARMCREEYLVRYLTKPELAECRKVIG